MHIKLAILLSALTLLFTDNGMAQSSPMPDAKSVQSVDGIGGFFFRARDPKALADWYAEHLGIKKTPSDYNQEPWGQAAGPTIFEPFPADSKLFERSSQTFVLNFRVHNLDAMVTQLRRANIAVDVDPQVYPNGRFAATHDLEGNPIQLWQPHN